MALLAGPTVFLLILTFFHPVGLSSAGTAVLASTLWIAIWWITEAVSINVTSLLPIILFPLTGALNLGDTTAAYGHQYVFLYLGGFIIAIAIETWGLHRRIALNIIRLIGSNVSNIVLGFMVATAFISMWISNTATAVMMMPIGMAIISQLKDHPDSRENENLLFGKALMISVAYSASIGGMATLIGTPPNLVLAGVIKETYGLEISFLQWLMVGLPVAVLLIVICWIYLTRWAFPIHQNSFPGGRAEIGRLIRSLGQISYEEKIVLVVFICTAMLWIFRSFLTPFIPALDDTIIAMVGGFVLFLLPSAKPGEKIMQWEQAVKLPWGIILLFGGGMALAEAFKTSGLAAWLGGKMVLLEGLPILLVVLLIVAAINFLTEVTSNLATTAMILPILVPMALTIDVHPYLLLVSATLAASCAFMLPVATPPNAVVFGSGYLSIKDMVKTGVWMNITSIIILTAIVYFLLPLLWSLIPDQFPEALKK